MSTYGNLCIEQTQRTVEYLRYRNQTFHSIQTWEFRLRQYHVDDNMKFDSIPSHPRPPYNPNTLHSSSVISDTPTINESTTTTVNMPSHKKQQCDASECHDQQLQSSQSKKQKEATNEKAWIVARPFANMRGHTAYITFAQMV
jgi:tRNA A58 N-methylase Trm61